MHVHVNAAVSVDGKISSRRREQVAISGSEDFDRVDRIRAAADGVMVGVGTVLADDPRLGLDEEQRRVERLRTGRNGEPARVIADSRARTPPDARVLGDETATYVFVAEAASDEDIDSLKTAGATVIESGTTQVDLPAALERLEEEGLDRLLVEGGGELLFSMFNANLVDEVTVYVGSMLIGGRDAPTLVDGDGFVEEFPRLTLDDVERIDDGVLLSYEV